MRQYSENILVILAVFLNLQFHFTNFWHFQIASNSTIANKDLHMKSDTLNIRWKKNSKKQKKKNLGKRFYCLSEYALLNAKLVNYKRYWLQKKYRIVFVLIHKANVHWVMRTVFTIYKAVMNTLKFFLSSITSSFRVKEEFTAFYWKYVNI